LDQTYSAGTICHVGRSTICKRMYPARVQLR